MICWTLLSRISGSSNTRPFDPLLAYCRNRPTRSGELCWHFQESLGGQAVACSDAVCTGLQLANFWQDVRRDHQGGSGLPAKGGSERFG
ncbi:MAG: hypothetical protein Ct9H300mP1_31690 [Planctomycetaceae bacterium]|nr:MAG: hypothetical protein Ct9H300mP1_31690 [Planctomycetaceae bacterium]